ncbi:cathepsin l [Anaeramoeba ignava]|uniref:Cathepsin l n=1 Tax=Anaeramoeba ignava TaxID=1746090 RepID=A0A9Q0LNH4_ANAIG|nr:cathepsin l [Anaeramoeba ignava]
MKFILLFAILFFFASCANDRMLFNNFKTKFNKKYSVEEEAMRFKIFQTNLKTIQEHNAGDYSYKMGINQFTDLTNKEYQQKYLSPIQYEVEPMPEENIKNIGGGFNWVDHGAVTPVKDQGKCGSCWAFSTTGMIEGCTVAYGGSLISLSEQEIVDCDSGSYGCNGGWPYQAMQWVTEVGGLCSEQDYPYVGVDQSCQNSSCQPVSTLTDHRQFSSEGQMEYQLQTNGPISVSIDASGDGFKQYSSGVYTGDDCTKTKLDHAVLVVGYNVDTHPSYWIVKNSWGTSWGLNGYIWMEYGKNTCGILIEAWWGIGCHNL